MLCFFACCRLVVPVLLERVLTYRATRTSIAEIGNILYTSKLSVVFFQYCSQSSQTLALGGVQQLNLNIFCNKRRMPHNIRCTGLSGHPDNLKAIFASVEFCIQNKLSDPGSVLHGDVHGRNLIVDESFTTPSRVFSHSSLTANLGTDFPAASEGQDSGRNEQNLTLFECLKTLKMRNNIAFKQREVQRRYGLIDFGDMSFSYRVLEIGRLIADLMVTKLSKQQQQARNEEKNNYTRISNSQSDPNSVKQELPDLVKSVGMSSKGIPSIHDKAREGDTSLVQDNISAKQARAVNAPCPVLHETNDPCSSPDITYLGGFLLRGYQMTNNVLRAEVDVLKAAVMASPVQYFVLGKKAMLEYPDNQDYNSQCVVEAKMLLWSLDQMDTQILYNHWAHSVLSSVNLDLDTC